LISKKQTCMMVLMRRSMPSRARCIGVDRVDGEALVEDLLLHASRQGVPHLLWRGRGVEQEHATGRGVVEHVVAVEEDRWWQATNWASSSPMR